MASVEQMQSKLNSLSSGGTIPLNFIPPKDIIIQNMMKGVVKRDLSSEEINQVKNSFTGALIEKEIQNLKANVSSFTKAVPPMAASIAAQIGACAAVPTAAAAAPGIISGVKGQLETLNSQASQILSSCVFLKIEIPDAFMGMITMIGTIKKALDAIPI